MFKTKSNKKEKGQGLVEYALILVLVAIVVIAVLMLLGPIIVNVFSTINNSISTVGQGGDGGGGAPAAPGPNEEQDFGSTQWKNGWDTATPINNYCASEGSGAGYNLYNMGTYYIASGYPWGSGTFMNTGYCP